MKLASALALCLGLLGVVAPSSARADGCYNCSSGGSCNQCRYGSSDTQAARKACESRGCKITGTGSCSTAANVKVCKVEQPDEPVAVVAWCAPGR